MIELAFLLGLLNLQSEPFEFLIKFFLRSNQFKQLPLNVNLIDRSDRLAWWSNLMNCWMRSFERGPTVNALTIAAYKAI